MRQEDIKKVFKIIFKLSDGVVEFESLEEDIEEYVDVMEESIDVDIDEEGNQSFKACAKCRICLMNVHNLRKHMVKTHYEFSL